MERSTTRYRSVIADSVRWNGFVFRDDDIIISTPPKCGTTWTQTIVALLLFQTVDLPSPIDQLSPWLDQSLRPLDEVVSDLDTQTHRRFIKSHLPLDGLPWDDRVTYVCVARDPRDVAMSWDNHINNIDFDVLFAQRDRAVGNEDLAELITPETMQAPAETPAERFRHWIDEAQGSTGGLAYLVNHIQTFWDARERPNVIHLHYARLQTDLEGEMRALASTLGIDVPEQLWGELVKAATFEEMKRRAPKAAPNASDPIWKDTSRFFNKGTSGQWRAVIGESELDAYEARLKELATPELTEWLHQE
ncbi:MAG: sulfotransferase domain-containing protein [Actinomycetota bacterium]